MKKIFLYFLLFSLSFSNQKFKNIEYTVDEKTQVPIVKFTDDDNTLYTFPTINKIPHGWGSQINNGIHANVEANFGEINKRIIKSDNLYIEENFKNNLLHGNYIEMNTNSYVKKYNSIADEIYGELVFYEVDNGVTITSNFYNGEKHGNQILEDREGNQVIIKNIFSLAVDDVLFKDKNGNIKYYNNHAELFFDKDFPESLKKFIHSPGPEYEKYIEKVNKVNGVKQGRATVKDDLGHSLEYFYVDGKITGPAKYISEGKYTVHFNLIDGIKQGKAKYISNLNYTEEFNYVDDLPEGKTITKFINAISTGEYKKGILEGKATLKFSNGNIEYLSYTNGILDPSITKDFPEYILNIYKKGVVVISKKTLKSNKKVTYKVNINLNEKTFRSKKELINYFKNELHPDFMILLDNFLLEFEKK